MVYEDFGGTKKTGQTGARPDFDDMMATWLLRNDPLIMKFLLLVRLIHLGGKGLEKVKNGKR